MWEKTLRYPGHAEKIMIARFDEKSELNSQNCQIE
jgi:hypothetical protein